MWIYSNSSVHLLPLSPPLFLFSYIVSVFLEYTRLAPALDLYFVLHLLAPIFLPGILITFSFISFMSLLRQYFIREVFPNVPHLHLLILLVVYISPVRKLTSEVNSLSHTSHLSLSLTCTCMRAHTYPFGSYSMFILKYNMNAEKNTCHKRLYQWVIATLTTHVTLTRLEREHARDHSRTPKSLASTRTSVLAYFSRIRAWNGNSSWCSWGRNACGRRGAGEIF